MYAGIDFDPMTEGESEPLWVDFVQDLPTGDSISAVEFSLTVQSGTDPAPETRLDGLPGVSGTMVGIRVSGALGGVTYNLIATVTTALGNTLILYGGLPCEELP